MILGLILGNKIVTGLLIALVTVPPVVYGGIKANEYRQASVLLSESRQLTQQGKYQEAIGKLTDAQSKWSLEGTKKEIDGALEDNKTLVQSSKDYELGKEMFDKDKYKDALEILKKVDSRNINYSNARNLIELAEKKIADNPKGVVAGVKTEIKKTAQGATGVLPSPLPTPSPSPLTPIPTPQPTSTIDPGKTAELRNIVADIKRQAIISGQAQALIPFYQDQLSACLNHVSETINNAPIVAGSKLNFSPSQIQTMRDGCNSYQADINNQNSIYNAALKKFQEDKDRANILSAECPPCWEIAKKDL